MTDPDPRERASIHDDLSSGDEEVRRLAVERLVQLSSEEALPLLAERLGDPSWRVRKAAVECLANVPADWPAAALLIRALADGDDPGRRNAAVEALVRIGRRVVDPLLAASEDPDPDVRKLVVDALGGIASDRAAPRLADLLEDADANVRSAAADALAILGGDAAQRALLRTALREDEQTLVRFAALRGLARLEAPLAARELASALGDPVLRPAAIAALGHTVADPEGEEVLLKGLEAPSRPTREASIEALLRIVGRSEPARAERLLERMRAAAASTSLAVEDAIRRLAEADLGTRLLLAQFLGVVGAPAAVHPLLRAAGDEEALAEVALGALVALGDAAEEQIDALWNVLEGELRVLGCEALGRTRGPRGAARLLATLAEPDPRLRAAAARALGRRAEPTALPALLRCLQESKEDDELEAEEEREALIDALVRVALASPPDDAVELVAASLETAAEPVRLAVARLLGEVATQGQASRIALLAQDPSPVVRRAAVGALARVPGGARAEVLRLALADETAAVRIAAADALAAGDGADPADLEGVLADEDADVRAAAVRAIAELWRRRGHANGAEAGGRLGELLTSALADQAPVAIAAVAAFEHLAPGLPLDAVQGGLTHADPEVVQSAVRCIRLHGDVRLVSALIPLVSHPHWAVRAGAIEALAERRLVAAVPAVLRGLDGEHDEFVRGTLLRALERLEEA